MSAAGNPGAHAVDPSIGRSVSIDEAALLLRVSRRTIYNRIRDGRLQTVRTLGGSQRVLLHSMRPAGTAIAQWQPALGLTSLFHRASSI